MNTMFPPVEVNIQVENESSIKDNIEKIKYIRKQLRDKKKLLKKQLEENSSYEMISQEVKEKQNERREVKQAVIRGNEVLAKLEADIGVLNLDVKMRQTVLSEALIAHEKKTGQLTIPGLDMKFEKVIKARWS